MYTATISFRPQTQWATPGTCWAYGEIWASNLQLKLRLPFAAQFNNTYLISMDITLEKSQNLSTCLVFDQFIVARPFFSTNSPATYS